MPHFDRADRPPCPPLPAEPDPVFFLEHVLPVVRRMVGRRLGEVRCPAQRDDVQQEAALICWSDYLVLYKQGKAGVARVGSLARFAVRMALARRRPRGCGRRGRRVFRDVFDPTYQRQYGYRVFHIDDGESWRSGLKDNTITPPPEQAAFRIDFSRWLSSRTDTEQRVINELATGECPHHLARRMDVSDAWISQRRPCWRRSWTRFISQ